MELEEARGRCVLVDGSYGVAASCMEAFVKRVEQCWDGFGAILWVCMMHEGGALLTWMSYGALWIV